jgi:hypothetical protein
MPAQTASQLSYRGRTDSAGEILAAWKAAQAVAFDARITEVLRLRLVIGNFGPLAVNKAYKLQFNVNGAGWSDVSAVSQIASAHSFFETGGADSEHIGDHDVTTAQMSLPTGYVFVAGSIQTGDAVSAAVNLAAGKACDIEWTVVALTGNAGDTVQLRAVQSDGVVLNAYVLATLNLKEFGPTYEGTASDSAKYAGAVTDTPKFEGTDGDS